MSTATEHKGPRAVVVTGGGTGIGAATARAFARRGDEVLVVGRSAETLAATAQGQATIHTLAVDITGSDTPAMVVETALSRFGRLDVLVNNAATTGFDPIGKLDRADVAAQVATNLLAPIFLTQQAVDALEASRGAVVNISSAGAIGLRAMPTSSVYAATKAALDSLTRTWAVELGPRGIRVVSVAPGVIDTGVAVRAGLPEESYEAFLADMRTRVPSGRVGTPDDIAWWVVQLVEPGASYANGMTLAVDGGLSVT